LELCCVEAIELGASTWCAERLKRVASRCAPGSYAYLVRMAA
jgi:hypothetical protein